MAFWRRDGRFWVVGHRGAPTIEIENTLPSFERALADGANALELDLSVTADGEVVLWHDFDPTDFRARFRRLGLEPLVRYRPHLSRNRRFQRPVGELTLAEFRAHCGYARRWGRAVRAEIPTLCDFVDWAAGQKRLGLVFFDVKIPAAEELVRRLVSRVRHAVARFRPKFEIVFETASLAAARELRRQAPEYHHSLDVEPPAGFVSDPSECSAARVAIANRLRICTPQRPRSITLFPFRTHRRVVEADLELMRRHNRSLPAVPLERLCCFTINRVEEMRALIELGINGIQSDRPDLLHQVATACGCRTDPLD